MLNCPQLTHLSLTGVPPFLREEILRFCRQAPQEFNNHQRDVFCVFSGQKVNELRNFLKETFPTPPTSAAGFRDDTSPDSLFAGPSSAPDSARPFRANQFHHPFDWAAPPPPGLWAPQQQGPPASTAVRQSPSHAASPQNVGSVISPHSSTVANSSAPLFAQSAPSSNPTFMPPSLLAHRSYSPIQADSQPALFAQPSGLPGPSRIQFPRMDQDGSSPFAFITPLQTTRLPRQHIPPLFQGHQEQWNHTAATPPARRPAAQDSEPTPRSLRRASLAAVSSAPAADEEQGGVNL